MQQKQSRERSAQLLETWLCSRACAKAVAQGLIPTCWWFLCFCLCPVSCGCCPGRQRLHRAITAALCLMLKVLISFSKIKRPKTFIIV